MIISSRPFTSELLLTFHLTELLLLMEGGVPGGSSHGNQTGVEGGGGEGGEVQCSVQEIRGEEYLVVSTPGEEGGEEGEGEGKREVREENSGSEGSPSAPDSPKAALKNKVSADSQRAEEVTWLLVN